MIRTAPTRISETAIAASVRAYLEAQGLVVRAEVPVMLPACGRVTADFIACEVTPDGEWFTVVECKRRFSLELEAQATRWRGLANTIYVAYQIHEIYTESHRRRIVRTSDIGKFLISADGMLGLGDPAVFRAADTKLIAAAFHAHSGEHDAPAGSAGVKRMTGDRCLAADIAKYLEQEGSQEFKAIRRKFKTLKSAHQLRKLADENPDILLHEGAVHTLFHSAKALKA